MSKKEYAFESVDMKSYNIKSQADIIYRIYKTSNEFGDFTVSSLQEAISQSKIEDPFKIEIIMPKKRIYFDESELEEDNKSENKE